MNKAYSILRLPIIAVLYLAAYFVIYYSVSNNLDLLNYFDIESDFDFWCSTYLNLANLGCLAVSAVIMILWSVLHNSKIKNSHRLTENIFRSFLIFLFIQLLACIAFCVVAKGPEDILLLYPMLYLVPFIDGTIFFSTYLVSGSVVPGSRELWFKVLLGVLSAGAFALVLLRY